MGSERVRCPYCGEDAALVPGDILYRGRPDLRHKQFWRCIDCDAHVGCHPGGTRPLGSLATAATRKARLRAHEAFDALWRRRPRSRPAAYRWLAAQLKIPPEECHIGQFSEAQCQRVLNVVAAASQRRKPTRKEKSHADA